MAAYASATVAAGATTCAAGCRRRLLRRLPPVTRPPARRPPRRPSTADLQHARTNRGGHRRGAAKLGACRHGRPQPLPSPHAYGTCWRPSLSRTLMKSAKRVRKMCAKPETWATRPRSTPLTPEKANNVGEWGWIIARSQDSAPPHQNAPAALACLGVIPLQNVDHEKCPLLGHAPANGALDAHFDGGLPLGVARPAEDHGPRATHGPPLEPHCFLRTMAGHPCCSWRSLCNKGKKRVCRDGGEMLRTKICCRESHLALSRGKSNQQVYVNADMRLLDDHGVAPIIQRPRGGCPEAAREVRVILAQGLCEY